MSQHERGPQTTDTTEGLDYDVSESGEQRMLGERYSCTPYQETLIIFNPQ